MANIYGINYKGHKPRPTFEELVHLEDYPVAYPDRSTTFTRNSPLLTQLDGIGMMELQEQQRREMIERQKEDIFRQIASSSEYSLNELRAIRQTKTRPQNCDMAVDDIDVEYFEEIIDREEEIERME